ncbi:MAG: penicillin-binding transpeptidase domain-containing protein [Clostridia bacterium]|nr:penicillin-binding transpeptidase domain-containing protein [Clostridia bacterium]
MPKNLRKVKFTAMVLILAMIAFLAMTLIRIGYLQIFKCEEYTAAVIDQQTQSSKVTAMRGTIYDRNGKALAESASVNSLVCNPKQIAEDKAAEIVATRLAPIINLEYDYIYERLTKEGTRYQLIKKRLNVEESNAIKELKNPQNNAETSKYFKGISFEADSKRYYSYGIAPHVIGFTGYDNDGRMGIELMFDNELSGKPGSIISAQSASGLYMDYQYEDMTNSQKGADVVLTIDETIQHFLEKALEEAVTEYSLKEGAAGIVMNPKTGEVYAMATKPDFDVNAYNDISKFVNLAVNLDENEKLSGYNSDNPDVKKEATNLIMQKMWRNKAISDTYEPGSTFKIITAAEALEENVVNENSTFYCAGFKQIADRKIKCHKVAGHGSQNFVQGVQNSCNPVFMELGLRIGSQKFMEYFNAFGYTEKTGIELNGESGSIYYQKEKLSDTDIATSAFGQGFSITPIQHICAISAAINGGNLMKPLIVKEIRNENGIVKSYQPEIKNKVISEETSKKMREILESVVSSPTGSGKNAYIKGYRIGGKTGTSEKGRNNDKRIASFVGFAPADDPEIVCLIIMDEPQCAVRYGGTICAPVVASVIEDTLEHMGIERQLTEEEASASSKSVPEVRGMSVDEAKEILTNSGFKIRVSGNSEITTVEDQLPKPGASIIEGSTVIIYTEPIDEEKLVSVPDVSGLSVAESRRTLEEYGLNFEAVGAGLNSTTGAYAVKQSIDPGEKVQPATVISVEFRHASSD